MEKGNAYKNHAKVKEGDRMQKSCQIIKKI